MAGVILETLSNRKLIGFGVCLLILQTIFFLVGGIVSPAPYYAQPIIATKCIDRTHVHKQQFFVPFGEDDERKCESVESVADPRLNEEGITANQIVFALRMPLPKEGMVLDMSRWFQNLIGVLQLHIDYIEDAEMKEDAMITLDTRLSYRNKEDPPNYWTEIIRSTEERKISCVVEKPEKDWPLSCEPMPLFELGSCHHDYYLLNIRVPIHEEKEINTDIGALRDMELVAIIQTGGFTKVWFSIKLVFFPTVLAMLMFYSRRIREQVRPINLLEKTLFGLGCMMTFLNLPVELFSLWVHMPYMLLYVDIRQGFFYSALLCFWIIFAGEHLMDGHERNRLSLYWKHLIAVVFGCICLFVFEMCERFVILAGISACCYFIFLCYMIYRVMKNIGSKKASLPDMNKPRRKYYMGLIYRFKFLMLATLVCAALTVIFFIIGQVSESEWKWGEHNHLQYTSAFLTGVYGMWNLYVFALLFLYSPSRKYISALSNEDSEEEEVEFSNIPAETSAIQAFAQKSAAD